MTRWRRLGLPSLAAAVLACPQPAGVVPAGLGAEPELRVGLGASLPRVALGGDAELFLTDDRTAAPIASIPAGASWTVVRDGSGLRVVRPDGSATGVYQGISAVGVTEGRFASAQGRRYRGRLSVFRDADGLTLVNRVALEPYVVGVTGAEMGRRRPDERAAVEAQTVVSRTFALKNRGRWEALGFDVYGDTRDQAYTGVEAESPLAWEAARRTAGQVLHHHGAPIDAFFHSTCGYRTAGAEEAFRTGRSLPYLRPVSDERDGGYYCDISPRFRWREEWDASSLRAILSQTLPPVAGIPGGTVTSLRDIEVAGTTASGRVAEVLIRFARGDVRVAGSDVRRVLRPAPERLLGSAAFQLHVTRAGGEITRVVAAGAGWGHGVGMCQWGAVGRARAGQDYRKILATYYPGTMLERVY
jgi:stage II sporulation protein D